MSLPLGITALIPHRRPMLLLDELVSHGGRGVVCRTTIRGDMPFVADGAAPAMIALELFAQSAAVLVAQVLLTHVGSGAQTGAPTLGRGAFLGTHRIGLHAERIEVGASLEIRCELRGMFGTAAEVDCALLRGEDVLAEGAILVRAG